MFVGRVAILVLVSVTVVVLAGNALVSAITIGYVQTHYRAAAKVADLGQNLSLLVTHSSDLASAPSVSASVNAEISASEQGVRDEMTALRHGPLDAGDANQLDSQISALVASVERERLAAARGATTELAQAAVVVNQQLQVCLEATERLGKELRQSGDDAIGLLKLGTVLRSGIVFAGLAGFALWITHRRRARYRQEAERRAQARFEALVEHSSDLLAISDSSWNMSYVSQSVERLLGYSVEEFKALDRALSCDADGMKTYLALGVEGRTLGRAGPADIRMRHADGSWRILEMRGVDLRAVPEVGGLVWTGRDVSERRRLEAELEQAAFHDNLTGLANRALFRDHLTLALARATRSGHPVSVLLADLDGFKTVNDSLGHDAGDEVLQEIGARLRECTRAGDTVARLGGDEFIILVEGIDSPKLITEIAARIETAVSRPLSAFAGELRVGVSIGIAHSIAGRETASELLRNADIAMYAAKHAGRGRWVTFEPDMHARVRDRLQLSSDLGAAIERQELELYYQPTVRLTDGSIVGTEALLRWHHPRRGLMLPGRFVPLAEQNGQILPLGRWVLEHTCQQAQEWHERYPTAPPRLMAVNISGRQLADDRLLSDVQAIVAQSGIDPQTLVLEITESVLMHDVVLVAHRLRRLKDLGIRLAIDDFGTGYSSLAYLRQFPVDILKIDQAFVQAAVSKKPGGDALIRAIVDLAANLTLTTIAEGLETKLHAEHISSLGCQMGQGYLFSRPEPAHQLERHFSSEPGSRVLTPAAY